MAVVLGLHNIPEGMAVGVVLAGAYYGNTMLSMSAALALSIGIALQNLPEGAIISMPLIGEGYSKPKAFLLGGMSGIVEPLSVPLNLPAVGTPLNDMSWEDVSKISSMGLASSYFSVGDRKAITLNGTVGSLTFSNQTSYAYILGIDHNASIEGNGIHFQFGYTALSGGTNIAFVDSGNGSEKKSGTWFNMNNSASNSGGWVSSRMRSTICPAFKSALPTKLQAILKTVTKYTDNTGGSGATSARVTATEDDIFLLAEWEVFGARTSANPSEQSYQKQYDYYANGNSKKKYRHNSTSSLVNWKLRSPSVMNDKSFPEVTTSGTSSAYYATYSRGFAPAFVI